MSRGGLQTNLSTARELISFVWQSKHWWLTPIVVLILAVSSLVVLLETSAVAPFIYALF